MIKIPGELLDPTELSEAVEKDKDELNIEFVRTTIDKDSLTLTASVRLNFVMPRNIESRLKSALIAKFSGISHVNIEYIYMDDGSEKQHDSSPVKSRDRDWAEYNGYKKKINRVQGGKPILGSEITREPLTLDEIYETVGSKGEKSVDGIVFSKDFMPLRNGRSTLTTIMIHDKRRALCIKAFVDNDEVKSIDRAIEEGDMIRALGHAENDSYENEIVFRAKAINKLDRPKKIDTYEGKKRVELHAHTKMSDNDGFNEVKDLITTAADWGQSAVAITDHGVVQAFPDAMKTQAALKAAGKDIKVIYGLEGYLYDDEGCIREDGTIDIKQKGTNHIIILARNQHGIRDLYELVSLSHIEYFYKRPRIPRSILTSKRDNLIIGSACEAGELFRAIVRGEDDAELERIASYYDYLEIQPLGNNEFLVREGQVENDDVLIKYNMKVVEIADRLGKMTVATTDSHYPDPESAIFRNIIMSGMGFSETNSNSLYLRTTDEMMEEFSYLGDRAEEIVITNTNKVADMIDDGIVPISADKCPPILPEPDERLRKSCYEKAASIYGDPLPDAIADRLNVELNSIIENGYSVMYIAAQMLVQKSMSDGYLVGSRGSVGSSFVATMAGVTEVNPLPAHYVCPECKKLEFGSDLYPDVNYDVGYDMPDRDCPDCGTKMQKMGMNIPFATFLGFDGDKEPDIDLNFAGEYQSTAHEYVGEIFGKNNRIFKAGTVSKIESKTAFGHVKHYVEDNHHQANKYDIEYLTRGCTGVKRTTGQHPGGMVIVPGDREIYEFTPVQRPANKAESGVITTHFEYHSIENNLLKLDILGHNVPQMIRHLELMTGIDPLTIPLDDKRTLSIFTSLDELDIKIDDYKFVHGTYGIPEFGTGPTRAMLDVLRPTTVAALVKISGFAHGTDVWANNVQDLLTDGIATVDEVISSRDDIMNFLILNGVDNSNAFKIMEVVRKSKRDLNDDEIAIMKDHGIPDWYIWSCNKLNYLFPRAHAAAYVMMAIRMAWYKVYCPAEFYAAWLTSKIEDFDIDAIGNGMKSLHYAMTELEKLGNSASKKEEDKMIVYEVIYEMFARGYEFEMPELGASDPCNFTVRNGRVKIPFRAVPGVGRQAAESLDDAYKNGGFNSLDDVRKGTKLSGTNIDDLKRWGLFAGLPESAQISIFEI